MTPCWPLIAGLDTSFRMKIRVSSLDEIYDAPYDTLVDVRSPAEFADDHIPGAVSLPVLSNDERARVGVIYTQVSPFNARKVGAALVARNAARHIEDAMGDRDGSWRPLVYCWRGGQRSGAFASILSQIGWRAGTLVGGYRAYRRLVVAMLRDSPLPHRLVLLDGNTGTAKTEILGRLAVRGLQTLDLEALAAHRGSLLGAVNEPQPSQKTFESALAQKLSGLDPERPVVAEAESSRVGNLQLPSSLWRAMREADRIELTAPLDVRARYLARTYSELTGNRSVLRRTLAKFAKFQGHARVKAWQELAGAGAFETLAGELMRWHYDIRYGKSRMVRKVALCGKVVFDDLTDVELDRAADRICAIVSRYDRRTSMNGGPSTIPPIPAAG